MKPEETETERRKRRILEWMAEDDWKIQERNQSDALWLADCKPPIGPGITVGQMRDKPHRLVLVSSIRPDPAVDSRLRSLGVETYEELIWAIRFRLLDMNLLFRGVKRPLQKIDVEHRIHFDGASRDRFFRDLERVRFGAMAVQFEIQRSLGQPGGPGFPEEIDLTH